MDVSDDAEIIRLCDQMVKIQSKWHKLHSGGDADPDKNRVAAINRAWHSTMAALLTKSPSTTAGIRAIARAVVAHRCPEYPKDFDVPTLVQELVLRLAGWIAEGRGRRPIPETEPKSTTSRLKRSKRPVANQPPPKLLPPTETRKTELIGMDVDGSMYLWTTGNVQPASAFEEFDDRYIKSGHYVIQWKGQAITVAIGNFADGDISVHFMCSRGPILSMKRVEIEPLLLGRVIEDPEKSAELLHLINKASEAIVTRSQAPDRRRGSMQ